MFQKITIILSAFAILIACNPPKSLKQFKFDKPQQIYGGHVSGQSVQFDYSRYVSPRATEVEFVLFVIVGDNSNGKQFGWIKISNQKDFHFSTVWGNHQSTYFSWYSDTFTLVTTPDMKAKLQVSVKFGGLNNGINLYVSGYWENSELSQSEEKNSEKRSQLTTQTVIV